MPISGFAPHRDTKMTFRLPPCMFDPDDHSAAELRLGYSVGGGGGHELRICDGEFKFIRREEFDVDRYYDDVKLAKSLHNKTMELHLSCNRILYMHPDGWTYADWKDNLDADEKTPEEVRKWKFTWVGKNKIEWAPAGDQYAGRKCYMDGGDWAACKEKETEPWRRQFAVTLAMGEENEILLEMPNGFDFYLTENKYYGGMAIRDTCTNGSALRRMLYLKY